MVKSSATPLSPRAALPCGPLGGLSRRYHRANSAARAGATGGAAGAGAAGGAAGAGSAGGAAGAGATGGAAGAGAAGGAAGPGAAGGTAGARAAGGAAGAGAAGGAAGARAAGAVAGAGAAGGAAGAGAAGGATGAGAAGPGGSRTGGTGAAGAGGAAGVGAAGTGAGGAAGVVAGDPDAEGTGAVSAVPGGAARPRPYYVPLLQQVLGLQPSPGPTPPLLSPPQVQSQSQLQPASPLPGPSPYSGPTRGLTESREPESRPVSPESLPESPESRSESHVHTVRAGRRVTRPRPPPVPGTHSMTLRPSSAPQRVPLPSPPASSLPNGPNPKSDSLRATSPTVTRFLATAVTDPLFESSAASALVAELVDFEEFECSVATVPHLVSMVLAPEGDSDAPGIPTPRSYAEAIEGPFSSQWQAAMDAEMASWKSTGTYVDEVPPPGANIVSGMWIFMVKRPSSSPPVFKSRFVARGFSQRQGVDFFHTFSPTPKITTLQVLLHVAAQRDYELHSLDFSTAFLQGSLHEEIWLRRPPGFTGTTLAALGFAPSTADPSLFLRTDTTLPPFYVLVYVDDLVFATANTEALAHVLQRFGFTYSSPYSTPLPTGHSLSAPPSDESVEPSRPYPELVGCLTYLMTCTRPDLAYPLSFLARYVAPGRHRKVHWDAGKRVLRYLCSTSGMGLVLGGWARVVLTGHADASWVDDLATQRSSQGYTFSLGSGSVYWRSTRSSSVLSSNCEADIYVGAMAAQELRWLTYLLTDLGEAPRSPPVLYVDNKAMLALCQEHRLEHRTKHIALRYFLARELQQRGQLRLAYVASQANTADVFTKALQPYDHQPCFAFLDWSCDLLFSPTLPMGQAAPAQSINSDNNNRATPMSLDGSSYACGNQQQPTFAPYEPQRGSISFASQPQPSPGQEDTLDALQVQSQFAHVLKAQTSTLFDAKDFFTWSFEFELMMEGAQILGFFDGHQWPEAMDHAVMLHNLLSSSSLPNNASPHLLWTGKLGNTKMLRVFGCMVQYRPHTARAGRFSQRAQWGLHLGIKKHYNAWKLFDVHSKETVAARDVIFYERLTLQTYLDNLAANRDLTGGFRGNRAFASVAHEADWDEQNVDRASEEAGPLPYCSVPIPMDDENPRESVNAETYFDFADTGYVTPQPVDTNVSERIGPIFLLDPEAGHEAAYPEDANLPRYTQSGLQILGLVTAVHGAAPPKEPANIQKALGGEHREKLREAMDTELKALQERNTWKIVPFRAARNGTILMGKWVFNVKTKADGAIDKFKARWVVRGFDQEQGRDFTETFAPVSRHT
ncbi:unnamed protein product [Closterium sp. NIES-53]